jgi:hypothetical protein
MQRTQSAVDSDMAPRRLERQQTEMASLMTGVFQSQSIATQESKNNIVVIYEKLRKDYLFVLENNISNPEGWKRYFSLSGEQFLENIESKYQDVDNVKTKLTIANGNSQYEFDNDKKVIFVGRMGGCDVGFKNMYTSDTSRVNAVIFPCPKKGKIFVVDVGSHFGIKTELRESKEPKLNSIREDRNILVFDWNEKVVLRMGTEQVGLFIRDCVCCMERPRGITFRCGHNCCCVQCADELNNCPLCRERLVGIARLEMRNATMAI